MTLGSNSTPKTSSCRKAFPNPYKETNFPSPTNVSFLTNILSKKDTYDTLNNTCIKI